MNDDQADGFEAAIDLLLKWADTEDAARAVHKGWANGMAMQFREVRLSRQKWQSLDPNDQRLDQHIAQVVVRAAVEALKGVPDEDASH